MEADAGDAASAVAVRPEEIEALYTPIVRRSNEMVDHLVGMVSRAGFPVGEGLEKAARDMCEILTMEELDEGEVLFEEGTESSDIYIVLSGSVHVRKKTVPKPINTIGRGRIFGEMQLLHSDPVRHSSIVAAEDTKLARMDAAELVHRKVDLGLFEDAQKFYKDLQDNLDAQAAEESGAFEKVSDDVRDVMLTTRKPPNERTIVELDRMLDIVKSFGIFDPQKGKKFLQNHAQARAVCAVLHCRTFEPGRCVCAEGEEGQTMYIVLYGRLAVSHINSSGESQHLKDILEGEDFGELAMLGDNVRTATVVANEFSVLLELQRPDYDATFRQADEEEIIEKVQNLTVCPLFNNMSLKKMMRIAYSSHIMTFSKDQTILTEGVRSSRIFFVISGLVAVTTVCRDSRAPNQTFLVNLGNRQSGSILGVEAALSREGQSHFTYVALSEVRVLGCQTAALTRRCTKEFTSQLAEYAEACLTPAAVNRMVLVETEWIKTRNHHHLAATGLRPMPPPPLADDESRRGGAALRIASAQSLAKLAPQSMASLSASTSQMTPRMSRAMSNGTGGGETPRLPQIRMNSCRSEPSASDGPVVSQASRALLDTIDDSVLEMESVERGMTDLKDRMGSLIELRDEQAGRSTPTPEDIAQLPGEAYRRSLQLRLWDPLVRLNHLGRNEKQKEKEAGESMSLVNPAAADARKEAASGGPRVVEVDLSRRLPKQFGMFTEMVYGVTVLWATITCNTTGIVPGLAWHYFTGRLFRGFEEQGQMRGLMRSENREVSNESSFVFVGGMPHTKSYSQKPDGKNRSAALVCDVAMRMIEDVEASNKKHHNLLIELKHQAAIASTTHQPQNHVVEEEYILEHPLHEHAGDASPRVGADKSASDTNADHLKSFDVSIRIGISSGSVAINVFGTKSPVYFGACGSEVDTARLLALAQPDGGAGNADGTDAGEGDDTADAEGGEPEAEQSQGAMDTDIGTMAVLSDSTNELVQDGYFTAPATNLQKVDAQGNKPAAAAAPAATAAATDAGSGAGGGGHGADPPLSGWTLSGKKEAFIEVGTAGTAGATAASTASAANTAAPEAAHPAAGGSDAALDNMASTSTSRGFARTPKRSHGFPGGGGGDGGRRGVSGGRSTATGGMRLSRSPRRPEHLFRAAQSQLRASAHCAPAARQMMSPRMLSARLRPTVSARVRPPVPAVTTRYGRTPLSLPTGVGS